MMREGERAERSENGADYLKASRFMGYVTGVADALGTSVCLPDNVTIAQLGACLLYTSDAADERSSVDLGGRRIIKKKKT